MDSEKYEIFFRLVRQQFGHGGMRIIFNQFVDEFLKRHNCLEKQEPNTTLFQFGTEVIPPRIIEDFEHIIRPYIIKHANIDELKLLMDNGYQSYVMGRYMIEALQRGFIKKEIRDSINISYEQAHNALNWITKSTGSYGIVEREDLR